MGSSGRPSGRTLSFSAHASDAHPDAQPTFVESQDMTCIFSSGNVRGESIESGSQLSEDGPHDTARAGSLSPLAIQFSRLPISDLQSYPRILPTVESHSARPSAHDAFTAWCDSFMPTAGPEAYQLYKSDEHSTSPISEKSLEELNIERVVANPKLRHDINFDRELHFRPNTEGDKGIKKAGQAAAYWQALEVELELTQFILMAPEQIKNDARYNKLLLQSTQRLPKMFGSIRDILVSLMPDDDRHRVDDVLDVELLMQSIQAGAFDLGALANWLAELLKAHCAPMRDAWVNKMQELMSDPAADAKQIVAAMRELFGILEAMKLDVANHQVRYLKNMLITNTFYFERSYFSRRLAAGKQDVNAIRAWYEGARALNRPDASSRRSSRSGIDFQPFAAFTEAWLRSLTPLAPGTRFVQLPSSFTLDSSRIESLKADVRDLLFKHICCIAHRTMVAQMEPSAKVPDSADDLVMERMSIIMGPKTSDAKWQANIGWLVVEIVRLAAAFVNKTEEIEGNDGRFAAYADALEPWLQKNLKADTLCFQQAAEGLTANITQRTIEASRQVLFSGPNAIFEALAPPLPSNAPAEVQALYAESGQSLFGRQESKSGSLVDIVRRATQISVLHWRVWSPLVYEVDMAMPDEGYESAPSSRPASTGVLDGFKKRLSEFTFGVSSRRNDDEGYSSSRNSSTERDPRDPN